MTRTPLQRKTPLRRKSRMRTQRVSKYRGRPRDREYMAWVRKQPCCAKGMGICRGPIEADHAGTRGLGQKADDRTCIPLCRHHHRTRGSFSGHFRTWVRDLMRHWLYAMVLQTQERFRTREETR